MSDQHVKVTDMYKGNGSICRKNLLICFFYAVAACKGAPTRIKDKTGNITISKENFHFDTLIPLPATCAWTLQAEADKVE